MYQDTAETFTSEDGRFRVRVVYDTNAEYSNPREGDTGTWLYSEDDQSGYSFASDDRGADPSTVRGLVERGMRVTSLPRFLWLSQGRRAVTSRSPHSSAADLLLVESDTRVAEVAKYSTGLVERDSYLIAVTRQYSQWVVGEVFGIVSESATVMGASGLPDGWDETDSCWGFVGAEHAESAARDELARVVATDAAPRFGQLTFASAA